MNDNSKPNSRDRFDLEQELLDCWKITDDIKMYVEDNATPEEFLHLGKYYNRKFERLWNTFEYLIQENKLC